ncbi:MAG: antibiotic biosynthesis monooxygenase family protein [Dehalococcoidia bacterium]
MFVAMNNFKVAPGKEADFEARWRERETYLDRVPGFLQFMLLRCDTPGEFISHTLWESREAFENWTRSEQFTAGHRQGGSTQGVVEGPPHVKLYDVVLTQRAGAGSAT